MKQYPEYQENLTYLQKTALEGEIAFSITTANHDADIVYRLYTILATVPKNYYSYVLSCFRELCEIEEDIFERVRNEIALDDVPLWIWEDKCISDLKESLRFSLQGRAADISANLIKIRRKLIESSFILFCRKTSLIHGTPVMNLCDRILQENSLDFLHIACNYLKEELKAATRGKLTKKLSRQIMGSTFDIRDILSFNIEYEELKKQIKREEEKEEPPKSEMESIEDAVQFFFEAITSVSKPKESIQYVVKKVFNGSNKSTILRTFKTKSEAEHFVEDIIKQFPDLKGVCTFVIERGQLRTEYK